MGASLAPLLPLKCPITFLPLIIMTLSNSVKFISLVASTLLFNSIGSINPATAFSVLSFENGGFEDPVDFITGSGGWKGTGDTFIDIDTDINSDFTQIDPVGGIGSQALITTGRNTVQDDPNTPASTFNYSNTDPVTATDVAGTTNDYELQGFLGLSDDALDINRANSLDDTDTRLAKEGSAIYQDFTVDFNATDIADGKNSFRLSFNFGYLTNDGNDSILGDQDFAFLTVYQINAIGGNPVGTPSITVLDDSNNTVTIPMGSGETDFQEVNTALYNASSSYIVDFGSVPAAGTYNYRVGFGVVDVDGLDRTSGLLLDNISVQQVPFNFSPGLGLLIAGGLVGVDQLRRKIKNQSDSVA